MFTAHALVAALVLVAGTHAAVPPVKDDVSHSVMFLPADTAACEAGHHDGVNEAHAAFVSDVPDFSHTVGDFVVTWVARTKHLEVSNALDTTRRVLWGSVAGVPFLSAAQGKFGATESDGSFFVSGAPSGRTSSQSLTSAVNDSAAQTLTLGGTLARADGSANLTYSFTLAALALPGAGAPLARHLAFDATVQTGAAGQNGAEKKYDVWNRVYLTYAAGADESFYGFGTQYSVWDLRGLIVPVLTSEQGIGRGLKPLTGIMDLLSKGSGGDWHTQYSPVPHYVSSELNSLMLENTDYAEFNLASAAVAAAGTPCGGGRSVAAGPVPTVEVAVIQLAPLPGAPAPKTLSVRGRILYGADPLELVEAYTEYSGRMQPLPEWAAGRGALVGMMGGTANVTRLYEQLVAGGVPVAGLWLQDWSGIRYDAGYARLWWNWQLDTTQYPGWDALHASLARNGARLLTYVNPFVANTYDGSSYNLYAALAARGLLVNVSGAPGPLIQTSGTKAFSFATFDLTNPRAVAWVKAMVQCFMLGVGEPPEGIPSSFDCGDLKTGGGASGWMHDFGEYIPFDAVFHDGGPGGAPALHNAFPVLWQRAVREAVREAGKDADTVFFSRSGAAQSPGETRLFWLGDQLTSWDRSDGLGTAVLGALTCGLSGYSLTHSDIGGYTMVHRKPFTKIVNYLRSKELLLRWAEQSAFADAVFRSHPGNLPALSWQAWSDNATMAGYGAMARVHSSLWPYRSALMAEAAATGHPLARHPWLHFWRDTYLDAAEVRALTRQFMVGPRLLVAPVVESGAALVSGAQAWPCYLPGGAVWRHLWTNATFDHAHEGAWVNVSAPLGHPPVFENLNATSAWASADTLAGVRALAAELARGGLSARVVASM